MRIWLITLILPLFLFAQTSSTNPQFRGTQKTFNANCLVKEIHHTAKIFAMKGNSSIQNEVNNNSGYNNQGKQTSAIKFTKNSLWGIKKAGNSLEWSFYLKYGANAIGLLETLTSYQKPNTDENNSIVDLSKRKTVANVLSFGSFALELHSLNNIGRSGTHLQAISNNFSGGNSRYIYEASRKLKKARAFGIVSTSLGIVASTAMMYGLSQDVESDDFVKGVSIGGSFGLAALVFKFISVNNVKSAGIMAGKFSKNIVEQTDKEYFNGFSNGLLDYERHWKKGFSLTMSGVGIIAAASLIPASSAVIGGVIIGGVMMLAGNIYMDWVAPYDLGEAGGNLTSMENSKANE